jgi:hypothetical protein
LVQQKEGALVEEEEGTLVEEEGEPKTPLQSAYEEGKDLESTDKKCFGSNNQVTIELWHHEEECGSQSLFFSFCYKNPSRSRAA